MLRVPGPWAGVFFVATFLWASTCAAQEAAGGKRMPYAAKKLDVIVAGEPAVLLEQPAPADPGRPAIVSAEVLPGRGMNIFQIRAHVPGRGITDLLVSPSLEEGRKTLVGDPDDPAANKTFGMGAPILLPWANRIRGKLSADGKSIEATVLGKPVKLLSNGAIKKPGDEPHAIHGFLMARRVDKVTTEADANHAAVHGVLEASDFDGRWLSKTHVAITVALRGGKFALDITATNAGSEPLPVGIGWHPFFAIPSGRRDQARVRIPARQRAVVNNYDEVFPSGALVPVKDTPFDFSRPGGAELKQLYVDDCFMDLERTAEGHVVAELIDPAAKYGLRIRATSPEVTAVQAFSPLARTLVALEPQFNWADPFSSVWGGKKTGMVVLEPGRSVRYSVEVELFVP